MNVVTNMQDLTDEDLADTSRALMAELDHAVVVCTLDGRILLYNERARGLADRSGVCIGPGIGSGAIDEHRAIGIAGGKRPLHQRQPPGPVPDLQLRVRLGPEDGDPRLGLQQQAQLRDRGFPGTGHDHPAAAQIEEDGTITMLGRGSVSINTGGEKVHPEEVEAALKAHPEVFDALVIGIPDERMGNKVAAVVAMRSADAATLGHHGEEGDDVGELLGPAVALDRDGALRRGLDLLQRRPLT